MKEEIDIEELERYALAFPPHWNITLRAEELYALVQLVKKGQHP